LVFHAGQRLNEFIHRGAGTYTHNLAGDHVMQGRLAHQSFEFVLSHVKFNGANNTGCGFATILATAHNLQAQIIQ
jgi:hypothetical protein